MGFETRIAGQRFGNALLISEAFEYDNQSAEFPPCDALDDSTPKGVLAGTVAGLYGDLLVGRADQDHRAVGLFVENAQNIDYRGHSPLGSGKLTYMKGMGSYEIDVYETRNAGNSEDLVYVAGDSLYTSARGFLTKEQGPGWQAEVLGVVAKAPTAADPIMWVDLRI